MTHLHQPLSPEILRRSLPLLLRAIVLTTPVNSKSRFDALCALLGDDIIGGVWLYASTEWATLEASMRPLPDLLQELGIGSIRYLKVVLLACHHELCLSSTLVATSLTTSSSYFASLPTACAAAAHIIGSVRGPHQHLSNANKWMDRVHRGRPGKVLGIP